MSDRLDGVIAITGVWRLSALEVGLSGSQIYSETFIYSENRAELETAFSRTRLMKHA